MSRRIGCLLAWLGIVALWAQTAWADKSLLVRAVVNGKETSLFEKVVVVSGKAMLSAEPDGKGDPIEPFAIFFRLKADDGATEKDGFFRVGDSEGNPLGWIRQTDVASWSTRFVLEPTQPLPDRAFSVALDDSTKATLKTVPEGKRRFALITQAAEKNDEPTFPVIVYAGRVQSTDQAGTIRAEQRELRDFKLEIMFVLESTDFMTDRFDGVTQLDSMKGVATQLIEAIRSDSQLKGAVRFGLAEYQDSVERAKFVARVTCPLTDNYDNFKTSIDTLEAIKLKDDCPDDVIAGLNEAISTRAGWSDNSSKHVILLGSTSCQLYPKGRQPSDFGGDWNSICRKRDHYGFSSTGLSIADLIAKANPRGGSAPERARAAKTFHTILGGKDLPKLPSDLLEKVNDVVRLSDPALDALASAIARNGKDPGEVIGLCFGYVAQSRNRALARDQYKQISRNEGVQGIFAAVEPTAADIKKGASELSAKLIESFKQLARVRSGQMGTEQLEKKHNEITQTFYAIVGAAAEKFKDLPVLRGSAAVRDDRGREVAIRKVLVARNELVRLKSTLDAIHKAMKPRTARADRQDVTDILKKLQSVIVTTGAGQTHFSEDVKLKDAISDLPLRTTALDTTARDIAVMPSDAFEQWLNKLEAAMHRADDLLGGKAEWLVLSEKAQNEQFTFLHLNELP